MKGKRSMSPLTMSCGGQGNLQGLYALLRWTFCQLFNTPIDHYDAAEQAIVHEFWADEAKFGDEIQYHDKAVREAKKCLLLPPR